MRAFHVVSTDVGIYIDAMERGAHDAARLIMEAQAEGANVTLSRAGTIVVGPLDRYAKIAARCAAGRALCGGWPLCGHSDVLRSLTWTWRDRLRAWWQRRRLPRARVSR